MDKRICYDKLWIKNAWKVSSFHFPFHSILFSERLQLLRSLWASHPMENLVEFFSLLTICLQAKNQCDPVIPSGDIWDLRILQPNWLKAFPAKTQEQGFLQIWDLYSKMDSNINFHLNMFPAKINTNFFQNKGKTLFWGHFCYVQQ